MRSSTGNKKRSLGWLQAGCRPVRIETRMTVHTYSDHLHYCAAPATYEGTYSNISQLSNSTTPAFIW